MVSSNKILTVSYGTFSCTAEGFEDPLAVVKETTQFFRGVVGEDRFFGAEPPQVDPELANELMRQQITAEAGGGQLTLRGPLAAGAASAGALSAALAAGAARPAAAAQPAHDDIGLPDDDTIEATAEYVERDSDTEESAPDTAIDDDIDDDIPEPVLTQGTPSESVAAKLQRIRAVVETNAEDTEAEVEDLVASDTPEELDSFATLDPDEHAEADDTSMDAVLDKLATQRETMATETQALAELLQDEAELEDTSDLDLTEALGLDDENDSLDEEPLAALLQDTAEDEDEDFDLSSLQDALQPVAQTHEAPIAELDEDAEEDLYETAGSDFDEEDFDFDAEDEDDGYAPAAAAAATAAAAVASAMATAGATQADDAGALEDDFDFDDEDDDLEDEWSGFTEPDAQPVAASAPAESDMDDYDFDDDAFDDVAEDVPAPQPTPAPAPVRARVVKVKRAVFEQAISSGQLEEVDEDEPEGTQAISVPGADTSSLSRDEEEELARELAAVKAELSGALDDDDWDDDDDFDDLPQAAEQAPLRPDSVAAARQDDWDEDDEDDDDWDEPAPLRLDHPVKASPRHWDTDVDDLDSKARRATADLHGNDDNAQEQDSSYLEGARKAVKMASPARALLTEKRVEDNDTSRILDQTNEELEEPEGNRRRSAIAHLRAAVAATRGDRLLGRGRDDEEEAEPYREDLANVVRPRRPQPGQARSERPEPTPAPAPTPRPSPLKLVAEQRIGEQQSEASAPARPVRPARPRRPLTASAADAPPPPVGARPQQPVDRTVSEGFAEYAQSVGAQDLPELIEAAAAFLTFEKRQDDFSRPQLMAALRQAETQESSREDRLRLFGQLLREGKIEKTSGGRFTVSYAIRFKPRRAVG